MSKKDSKEIAEAISVELKKPRKQPVHKQRVIDTTRDVLTTADVAHLLGVSTATVSGLAAANAIPHLRVSSRVIRFPRASVLAWIERRTVEAE